MTGQAPPAIPHALVSRRVSLRINLADAAFHAKNLRRALEAAADVAPSARGSRQLRGLAKTVGRWAGRLDPTAHEERARRQRQAA